MVEQLDQRRMAEMLAPGEGSAVSLPGATIVFKALSGLGPTDFVVVEFTADPGFAGPRPHTHFTHEELFYILEGELDFYLEDGAFRVGPGTFVSVLPGVLHDFRNPGDSPARFLGIFAPGDLERYFYEVRDLVATGQLTEEALRQLRRRYDTEEPMTIPSGHWSAPA